MMDLNNLYYIYIYVYIYLCIHLFIYLSIYLFMYFYLFIHLCIYLFIYLFIYIYIGKMMDVNNLKRKKTLEKLMDHHICVCLSWKMMDQE